MKHRKKTGRRLLSLFVVLVMIFSLTGGSSLTGSASDTESSLADSVSDGGSSLTGDASVVESSLTDSAAEAVSILTDDASGTEDEQNNVFSKTALTSAASDILYGGETITAGGTYYLAEETTSGSVITIATTENVTIVGNGAEFDENGVMIDFPQKNLVFDASTAPGAHLTLRDVYISNGSSANLIDFEGSGNVLTIQGVCVLDHDVNARSYASVHVGAGTELTINGDGVLYFYKRSQGAGIGGDTEEMNGDITFDMDGGYAFIKGSKQGAVIGAGSNASSSTDAPGAVTFLSGTYNLTGNARGAVIGGSAGNGGGSTGTTVYIKGGLININTDFSGASVGGGGYAEGNDSSGGTMYVTGGSLRVYIDTNAAGYATTGWQGRAFTVGVNDASITAQRLNGDGEEVHWLWFDTQQVEPDENGGYTAYLDDSDTPFYSGSLYEYYFIQEALDKEAGEQYAITSTPQNWVKMSGETQDSNLYLWVPTGMESQDDGTRTGTPAQHKVTVNGEIFIYQWNEEEYAFELLHAGDHEYAAGKCSACGGVLDDYTWYYDNEDGNTFTVSSAAELAALADIVNSGADDFAGDTITLGGDVDLSRDTAFAGIGNSATPFAGTFDGGGRTVTLGMESDTAAALFAVVNGAVLENITTDGSVTGTSSDGTAGLAAVVGGDGVRMTDCVNEADISGAGNTGGLIGASDSVSVITVSGCTNSGTVTGTGDYAGGIVGQVYAGSISNTVNMENGTVSGASCVGGILGAVSVTASSGGSLTVEDCINYADVTGSGGCAAGIAGSAAGSSAEGFAVIIRRCGNEGAVFSSGPDAMYTGGIVGHDTGIYNILESLYNAGSVTGTAYVGGIAGAYNSAFENPLEDVYNVGTVMGSGDAVGGLIGYTSDTNTIRNAYSAGRVTEEGTSSLVGIIAGSSSKTELLTVDNVYYTDTLTGSLDGAGDMYLYGSTGSALTAEEIAAMAQTPDELRRLASVLGESFMFNSDSIYHAGYPVLTWEEATGTGTYRQYVLGDVNGDGSVTVHDVTWLERYMAGVEIPYDADPAAWDVDGDDEVTAMDVTHLARYIAGMDESCGIGEIYTVQN